MNMVQAEIQRSDGALAVQFGGVRLGLADELMASRPALQKYEGRRVIVGLRPEDMEDASLAADAPSDRRLRATIDLREALGAEVLVHFTVDAPVAVTEEARDLAADVDIEAVEELEERAKEDRTVFVARLNPRTEAKVGQQLELVVDTTALHFFDPDSGLAVFDEAPG
jgi:multiple sugar transport system ATP-binding protein